jgi:pimeloyl-ACP methyl ester carboxylesterase
VRLITVDRPGIGLSDACPRRRLLDWPHDVRQLADELALDRFAVLGWSAGGPFALACAYLIPDRLQAVGIMSGMSPLHWPGIGAAVTAAGGRVRGLAERMRRRGVATLPGKPAYAAQLQPIASDLSEVRPVNRQRLPDLIRRRQWERAVELAMLARPWGFRLGEIGATVHLWHGSRDRITPLYMAEYLVRAIPRAALTVFPDEGHYAGFTHWREIVQTLAAPDSHRH